ISTKSQRGQFCGTPDGLLHNGQACNFAQQALRQAMDLKDRLTSLMGRDIPWVQCVLAVPFGFTEGDACSGKVWLVHQDSVIDRVAPEGGARKLEKRQITRVVRALELIMKDAASVYERRLPEL